MRAPEPVRLYGAAHPACTDFRDGLPWSAVALPAALCLPSFFRRDFTNEFLFVGTPISSDGNGVKEVMVGLDALLAVNPPLRLQE